jgi:hypothetical protein
MNKASRKDIAMEELIRQAIRAKRLLTVCHNNLTRVVEPYAIYTTPDETLMLESRLVAGDYERTPPPHWCPIRLTEITSVTLLPQVFLPHPEYKPHSPRYQRAMCRV